MMSLRTLIDIKCEHIIICLNSCVLLYHALVTMYPRRPYQKDLLLTDRAKVSSWPSHHTLSAGSSECAGMWVLTGGEVRLIRRYPDTHLNHPPPIFLFHIFPLSLVCLPCATSSLSSFSLVCLKNDGQLSDFLFFLHVLRKGERAADKLQRKVDLI